jgi:DMSO/TMAO reductase YedYZ molybdopterin-dependent catalytic subunit
MSGPRARVLVLGAAAGTVAMLATTVVLVLLRTLAGVPLPLELVSDRFIPLLSVDTFLRLIDLMGGFVAGKRIGFVSYFVGQVALGAILGAVYAVSLGTAAPSRRGILLAGAVLAAWLVSLLALWPELDANYRGLPPRSAHALTALSLLLALALFAVALAVVHARATRPTASRPAFEPAPYLSRRTVLLGGAGIALGVGAGGLARRLYRRSTIPYDGTTTTAPQVDAVTPITKHYVVTKNFVDPRVDRSRWRLEITGDVDRSRTYTFDELAELPPVEQETTLECISNGVGGGLISNSRWRGVPVSRLLETAGVGADASHVFASAVDGFAHGLTLAKALEPTTLVAYRVNGEELPDRHGFPARLLVPGAYGETSVKWLTRIEVLDAPRDGFYERQGWRAEFVHTMSRIDRPLGLRPLRAGRTHPVNGIAFAGDRGIERVELSVDGGRRWMDATIDFHASRLTWALWSFEWEPREPGAYELVVRATDGGGRPQTGTREGIAPDGATGLHRIPVRVVAA